MTVSILVQGNRIPELIGKDYLMPNEIAYIMYLLMQKLYEFEDDNEISGELPSELLSDEDIMERFISDFDFGQAKVRMIHDIDFNQSIKVVIFHEDNEGSFFKIVGDTHLAEVEIVILYYKLIKLYVKHQSFLMSERTKIILRNGRKSVAITDKNELVVEGEFNDNDIMILRNDAETLARKLIELMEECSTHRRKFMPSSNGFKPLLSKFFTLDDLNEIKDFSSEDEKNAFWEYLNAPNKTFCAENKIDIKKILSLFRLKRRTL
jgi:hypothetical protein